MSGAIEVYRGSNGALVVNASNIALGAVAESVVGQAGGDINDQRIMAAMASWAAGTGPPASSRVDGIFDRNRYVTPQTAFEKIRAARAALSDDVVGGAADVTEALAFDAMTISIAGPRGSTKAKRAELAHQEDVWNQLMGDLDMDSRLREIWRTLYTDSQVVVATWWGSKTYNSRLPTDAGQQSRKDYTLTVPLKMSILDTTRVTPVGALMFNEERLAFIATPEEAWYIDTVLANRDGVAPPPPFQQTRSTTIYNDIGQRMLDATIPEMGLAMVDPIIARLVTNRYVPDMFEREQLMADGVNPEHLFVFDRRYVWRHCLTRPQYQRFSDIRLESVFPLLDAKDKLRAMDRAHLIGGANYIVLVTKGSDALPGQQKEIDNLRANVHTIGTVPIMVGDHRLKVEIVTPKLDVTLNEEKYRTLNNAIEARVYGKFASTGSDNADPIKSGRIITSGLEGRRRMERRGIEANLFSLVLKANPELLTGKAKIKFLPKAISLAFDPARATFMLDVRDAGDLSRDSLLGELGTSQAEEAALRDMEEDFYNDSFDTHVPHGHNPTDPNAPADPNQPATDPATDPAQRRTIQRRAGRRQGGTKNGGGRAPGTQQGKESINPRRSDTGPNKRPKPSAAVVDTFLLFLELPDDPTVAELAQAVNLLDRDELVAIARTFPVKGCNQMRKADLATEITAHLETTAQPTEDDE